ncbi:MAG: HEPN domain-containing protein [Candidatus Aenigmarchaeota archaeon]|nr:HEPN domain-containing protein [Candidatus Aenigmarchaeota archaeon]
MQEDSEKWLEKGVHDLSSAEINLRERVYDVAAFLSHQAAEKALKAILIARDGRLWKIHDLMKLCESVKAPKGIASLCEKLNPHYLASRYVLDVAYAEDDASEALQEPKEVVRWAKEELLTLRRS